MPSCYQLFRKSDVEAQKAGGPKAEPLVLQKVDEEICAHMGVPVHPKTWCFDWHNVIGYELACSSKKLGSQEMKDELENRRNATAYFDLRDLFKLNAKEDTTAGQIQERIREIETGMEYYDALKKIHEFMAANYTSEAWVEIGKR